MVASESQQGRVSGYVESLSCDRDRFVALAFCAADILIETNAEGKLRLPPGTQLDPVQIEPLGPSGSPQITLFDYRFLISLQATGLISLICIGTCLISAIYPAVVAVRTSSAKFLHYE